jgi:quercetin dioxygenase-like cupin family protein
MMNRVRTWASAALLLVLISAMAWTQAKPSQPQPSTETPARTRRDAAKPDQPAPAANQPQTTTTATPSAPSSSTAPILQQKEAPPKAAAPAAAAPVEDASGVVYFNQQQMNESFAKSGAIYKFTPEHNYQVSTVTRSGPGQAEIHITDTDIIYMLSGKATMVTGGTVEEAQKQSPTEIRGAKITGGTTREVSKGELIIIPKGTPHWTTATDGVVQLLVVKVR